MALGSLVVFLAVVSVAAAAVVYIYPPGRQTITFDTTDASSLSVGADVRIAGISVGKVADISIRSASVRVELDIEDSAFVGADSTVDVRMLTPVGGYAVTVIPIGDEPLGPARVIPVDRVTVPYSIAEVLQAAPRVTDRVEGGTIDADVTQLADALQHNATSVGSIIDGLNSIAAVMDRQRDQVHKVVELAAEYSETFDRSRDFIFGFVAQLEIVVSRYNTTKAGFNESYARLGDIISRVQPFMEYYIDHADELYDGIVRARDAIGEFQEYLGPALDNLRALQTRLREWLGPEGIAQIGGGTLLASDICVPTLGRTC
ncbi:MlaD family protein [Nocardia harenae]|uniref:MlaD family protein n=1 Tax=Nocardia harenae TaxID=358707 RepID=UPI001FDF9748|nr:MlaD family protein [Nocardia harenae]